MWCVTSELDTFSEWRAADVLKSKVTMTPSLLRPSAYLFNSFISFLWRWWLSELKDPQVPATMLSGMSSSWRMHELWRKQEKVVSVFAAKLQVSLSNKPSWSTTLSEPEGRQHWPMGDFPLFDSFASWKDHLWRRITECLQFKNAKGESFSIHAGECQDTAQAAGERYRESHKYTEISIHCVI